MLNDGHTFRRATRRSSRGSALSLAVLVSVVLTGLVMTLAWLGAAQVDYASRAPLSDTAFYVAEAGANNAMWRFKQDNQWRALSGSPLIGTLSVNNATWTYTATATETVGDATLAWTFNEGSGSTTADATGRGNTGNLRNGTSWTAQGRSGSAIRLDGVNDYVDCGNNASTNITGSVSFAAWVRLTSAAYDQKIGGNQSGVRGGYKFTIYNTKAEFEVRDANNQWYQNRDAPGGINLTMNTWHHLVGVYDASRNRIRTYVNGRLDREVTGLPANALGSTTGNFVFGKEPWTNAYYLGGDVDDVRIFARALTDQEIRALYDTTLDIVCSATNGVVSNTVALSASIPTPPPPTVPVLSAGGSLTFKNLTVVGDVAANGNVTAQPGNSTLTGNLTYGGTLTNPNNITFVDNDPPFTATRRTVSLPSINYANIKAQAGQTVNGNSSGQTFDFRSLVGNRVIWIKGNLVDPAVDQSGTWPAGGTFIIDGNLQFTKNTNIGRSGLPVYFIVLGSISHTAGRLTLNGGLYTEGNWDRRQSDITGAVYVKGNINDNTSGSSSFTFSSTPWFDNRVLPQVASLPMYTTNHRGALP